MTKTIRLSDEFHRWVKAHNEEGETMEQTLRRLTRGPHPGDVAGLLTDEEAEEAKATVEALRQGDAGIGPNDASIAAMADILDDAVLTENTADFEALGVATERY